MFKTLAITAAFGLTAFVAGCNQSANTSPALGAAESNSACCASKDKAACPASQATCSKAAKTDSACCASKK
ncbi:MAG: hypothetical protein MK077_01050 [Phycisphaerales bacterium]|nr:hypothetical protein [Phycisphaerales bacterium]